MAASYWFRIQACRSVVVLWTNISVTSEWVLEEAEIGKSRGILIPVLLDVVQPPFGFGRIQAANLAAWNGDSSSPLFARLVADIAGILGAAPAAINREAEAQRRLEEERVRGKERQRAEKEVREKAEEEERRRVEEQKNHARQEEERRRLEAEAEHKTETQGLYRRGSQGFDEDAGRKVEETNQRRVAHPLAVAVVALIIFGFVTLWSIRKEPERVEKLPALETKLTASSKSLSRNSKARAKLRAATWVYKFKK